VEPVNGTRFEDSEEPLCNQKDFCVPSHTNNCLSGKTVGGHHE